MKKSARKKIILLVVVLAIIGGIVYLNLQKKKVKPVAVQTQTVQRERIVQTVNASGSLIPVTEVKISANVSARIISLAVKEGDRVRKGDLLVELDKAQYEAAYEKALSFVQSSKANRKKVASDLKRYRALRERDLTSEAELEAAEAQMEVAESQVVQAEAALKQAQDDLDKTRIAAPMSGIVTSLKKEVGEIALGSVFQEDVILVISDMSKVEVKVEVDETDVVNVNIGDTAKIELDAIPNTEYRGLVAEIAHSATTKGLGTQEQVTNFIVEIAVIGQDERFRPGMSATVDIITDVREAALAVPIQALTARSPLEESAEVVPPKKGKEETPPAENPADRKMPAVKLQDVVFVVKTPADTLDPQDKTLIKKPGGQLVEKRPVKIGISSDTHFEILEGLTEGEEIVIGPYKAISKDLKDKTLIKITNKNNAKGVTK